MESLRVAVSKTLLITALVVGSVYASNASTVLLLCEKRNLVGQLMSGKTIITIDLDAKVVKVEHDRGRVDEYRDGVRDFAGMNFVRVTPDYVDFGFVGRTTVKQTIDRRTLTFSPMPKYYNQCEIAPERPF